MLMCAAFIWAKSFDCRIVPSYSPIINVIGKFLAPSPSPIEDDWVPSLSREGTGEGVLFFIYFLILRHSGKDSA